MTILWLRGVRFFIFSVVFCVLLSSPVFAEQETTANTDGNGDERYQELNELSVLYQSYLGNIAAYEPIYFLAGTDLSKSKLQFSFKYRFFNPEGSWNQSHPWLKGFHFAYTQTSFWDLKSDSQPFKDTSYKPELHFLSSNIDILDYNISRFFIQTGFQHESNGKAEDDSRGINMFYLKPIFISFNDNSLFGFEIAPKLILYLSNESEDKDIEDYRGYFDLEMKFGKMDNFLLGSHFRWAREGGSMQLDLTYPISKSLLENLNVYLHIQYTNSLAENLLNYQDRTEAFRIGFSFIR
ncbi:MAG: phospholipase A [Desulfobacterales bacterium]|nr:phospholipase A [Desulfobacterales bacterium]